MKYAWPVSILVGALLVAVGVFSMMNLKPRADTISTPELHHPDGRPLTAGDWDRKNRVIGILDARCAADCDPVLDQMAGLRRRLPDSIQLWSILARDPDGVASLPVAGPSGWNHLAGTRASVRRMAIDHLGFSDAELDRLGSPEARLLLVTLDRAGRPHRTLRVRDGSDRLEGGAIEHDALFLDALSARPLLHARLNATSGLILLLGFLFVRRKMIRSHVTCMILASVTTLTFLASYLYYHFHAGSVSFQGEGWSRPVYFGILLSHTILAAFVAPLAVSLFVFAARRMFDHHRSVARWTLPLWLYVSVTGVLIYCMLYIWFPGG